MMIAVVTCTIFLIGNILVAIVNFFYTKKMNRENMALRQEKFERDLSDVKKTIRDDINSMPLDELVKRK